MKSALTVTAVLILAGCGPLLSGCANPYGQYYKGVPDARQTPGYVNTGEQIRIYGSKDMQKDYLGMWRRGYVYVGQSAFDGKSNGASLDQVMEQAKRIGAHAVLSSSTYIGTTTGVMPLTTPTSSTSYTSGTATAYGQRGSVTAFGNATTTTYGTQTNFIPYSIDRSQFVAAYFVKAKTRLGTFVASLSDEERQALGSNKGVKVLAVAEGSPAFEADILPGDIIRTIGGRSVGSVDSTGETIKPLEGQEVDVGLSRQGTPVTKRLRLGVIK